MVVVECKKHWQQHDAAIIDNDLNASHGDDAALALR
jgi:hypothetical protein